MVVVASKWAVMLSRLVGRVMGNALEVGRALSMVILRVFFGVTVSLEVLTRVTSSRMIGHYALR